MVHLVVLVTRNVQSAAMTSLLEAMFRGLTLQRLCQTAGSIIRS